MPLHLCLFLLFFITDPIVHPSIDGKFSAEEWALAKAYPLKNGGTLYVLNDVNELYIALKGTAPGWAHLYIKHQDTLRVFHASAALGTAKYVNQNQRWQATSKFQWDMRDRTWTTEVQHKMNTFYKIHGWMANNNNMGDKLVFEYQIDKKHVMDRESKFAFVYAVDKDHPLFFPQGLNDQTINPDVLYGDLPDQIIIDTSSWILIKDL